LLCNLNVVKAETAKCGTFVERETVGMVHKLFWQNDDEWYANHIQASRDCLGHVTSGGTVANIEALWCARNTALPGVEALGLHGAIKEQGFDDAVIICSRLAHYSVSKACGILGLGTQQMISIPVNTRMQVDVDLMREALEDCKKKNKKVLAVIALAGSTECGSFDDLTAVAGLCKEHNVWMHVDAAWGGGLVFSPTAQQTLFKGVHHADSVTIDALTCKITCAPGSVVPIMAEPGVNSHIAVLAVLLRGCAWLIVDTSSSAKDVAKTLQEARASDVLLTAKQLALLTEAKAHLDEEQSAALRALTVANTEPLSVGTCAPPATDSDSVAQMLFTSGQSMKFSHRQLLDMFDEESIMSAFHKLLAAPAGTLTAASEIEIKKAMEVRPQSEVQQAC